MKKRFAMLCMVGLLLLTLIQSPFSSKAATSYSGLTSDSIKQKEEQIKKAEEQKKKLQNSLTDVKAVKKKLEQEKSNLKNYVQELDAQLAEIQDNIVKLNAQLTEKEEELLEMINQVDDYINSIKDSRIRRIMRYRYIDDLNWVQVARRIGKKATADSCRMAHDRFLEQK